MTRWLKPLTRPKYFPTSSHMVRGVRILLYDYVPAAYKQRALERMERALCVKHWVSPKIFNRSKTIIWGSYHGPAGPL